METIFLASWIVELYGGRGSRCSERLTFSPICKSSLDFTSFVRNLGVRPYLHSDTVARPSFVVPGKSGQSMSLALICRVIHIAATCTSLGGLFYARMVLLPTVQKLPEPD